MLLLITLAMQSMFSQTLKPVSCDELLNKELIVMINNSQLESMDNYFLKVRGYNGLFEDAFDIPDYDEYTEPYLFAGMGYFQSIREYTYYQIPENFDTWNGSVFLRWLEPHDTKYKPVFEITIESKEIQAAKTWEKFTKAQKMNCSAQDGYVECRPDKTLVVFEVGTGEYKKTFTLSFVHIRTAENRNPAFRAFYTME